MRSLLPPLALLVPLATPAIAVAGAPEFAIVDHGDTVEVTATGIVAASSDLSTIRERIEIPLTGNAAKAERRFTGDATIKLAETHGAPRMLSIKLNAERPTVRALVPHVQVKQDGDVLRVFIPRAVPQQAAARPASGGTEAEPEPEAEPEAEPEPDAGAGAVARTETETGTENGTETQTETEAPAAAAIPSPGARGPRPEAQTNHQTLILAGLGILALVVAGWMRRKRRQAGPSSTIEVLAQRSLGGKARVVWIAAGEREMVVAVTPQSVRMLGQWRRTPDVATARVITTERASQRPSGRAATNSYAAFDGNIATPDIAPSAVSRTPVGNLTVSPAVSGILKLRDRAGTVQPQPSEDEGLDDDAIWARELLAATGGRR